MDDAELKEQLERKKQELTVQFQRQADVYQSNIAAIDSAILVIEGKSQAPNSDGGTLRDKIIAAVKSAPMEFSIRDIARIIALRNPGEIISQQSIASSFWKIMKELDCTMITPGIGQNPTVYSKVGLKL